MNAEQKAAILDFRTLPEARPEDVGSPENIVRALYNAISGPPEKERERDWDRFRSLFLPNARFTLVRWQMSDGDQQEILREWDVEGFIDMAKAFWRDESFFEREISRRAEVFGHIAHVFSTYEARVGSEASDPVMRGINSIQVVHDGDRWWIANLVWDIERQTNPIPDKYLPDEL